VKCILRSEGLELLQEIHGGECGNYENPCKLGGKSLQIRLLLAHRLD
jgi:hypothetical protein